MALYTLNQPIPKRGKACDHCKAPFKPGDEVVSSLKGEERQDACAACWQGEGESAWRLTVVAPKRGQKRRFVDLFDRGLELLNSYLEAQDSKAYMLALYLQRQGALQRMRAPRNQKNLALFEVIETNETVAIPISDPTPPGPIERDLMQALTGDVP